MKLLFDFFPVILFFIAYKVYGIYVATGVIILASFAQVGWLWWRHGRVERMPLITAGLLLLFGGATLLLQDETFVKWKPTVANWLFALAFLGSRWFSGKTLIEHMMGASIELPDTVWQRLNLAWVLFFLSMGLINLYVAYTFSTDLWVDFKLFGMLGLTLVFVIGQGIYLARYFKPEAELASAEPADADSKE